MLFLQTVVPIPTIIGPSALLHDTDLPTTLSACLSESPAVDPGPSLEHHPAI
jgi:hypothetical protein